VDSRSRLSHTALERRHGYDHVVSLTDVFWTVKILKVRNYESAK
jgi:hypothetical protein